MREEATGFAVASGGSVSGLLMVGQEAKACLVLAHGAGAGMTHPFMADLAGRLAGRDIATLRFQFPYMESGSRRPDRPPLAIATVRAAVAEAAWLLPGIPLFAGGKSFGGRMTSQAEAAAPLAGVNGLVFLGFPLHPAGKPATGRGDHLADVKRPMLFLQGRRDKLAEADLIAPLCAGLPTATLHFLEDADHSFHVPKRSGRDDAEVRDELAATVADWTAGVLGGAA